MIDGMPWAIVEVMGHRRYAGQVEETTLAGAPVLRVRVPELVTEGQETEWRSRPSEEGGGEQRWSRTVTRRYPGFVVDLGGGALFAVTRCPEAHARAELRHSHHALDPEETHGEWMPPAKQLPGPVEDAEVVDGSEFMQRDVPTDEIDPFVPHDFRVDDEDGDWCTVCGEDRGHKVHRLDGEE